MTKPATDFSSRAHRALGDSQVRSNFRRAMDGLMKKFRISFPDESELEILRQLGSDIRTRALDKLPELLEQMEANCRKNGIKVHWAETTEEANQIVLEIVRRHGASHLIKGKSMVTEEMELNHFMEERGFECLESDLGEFIVQLAHETPSHIIMPAIHKNIEQISELIAKKVPGASYTENVDELTNIARQHLRRKFCEAEVGISGVNFMVAETGTLCIVTNEGNGRLTTTAPPVHIAVTGIEKMLEKLEDVPPLLHLLTKSATGQTITTYFNMITSPRKPGDRDGPHEVHLILLDNGRSRVYADQELRETLKCIRCGACMNHCPVYTRIGGHAYGFIYPGPIGKVLTPQMEGLERAGDLAGASTLCGACSEICPVRIPLPQLILRMRYEMVQPPSDVTSVLGRGVKRTPRESLVWKGWQWMHVKSVRYGLATRLIRVFWSLIIKRLEPWTAIRSAPKPARKSLHSLVQEKIVDHG